MLRKLIILALFTSSAYAEMAGPYLKIQQVRALDYPYVKVEISVTRITPIHNLNESHFKVFENGWHVPGFKLKKTDSSTDPKHIVLLVDSSLSIPLARFKKQIEAAKSFINNIRQEDYVAIKSFDDQVKSHCGFTSDNNQLVDCLNSVQRNGRKTVLFDALHEGITQASVTATGKAARSSVIVFTDGRDEGSLVKLEDLVEVSGKHSTPVFVAGTGNKARLKPMARLSRLSGAETYYTPSIEDLKNIYKLLSEVLDNTYLLQYVSQAEKTSIDGKRAELEIHLNTMIPHEKGLGLERSFKDQDKYVFRLPESATGRWFMRLWQDERYLLFGAGIIIIILLIILLVALTRKSQINVNLPEPPPVEDELEKFIPHDTAPLYAPKKSMLDQGQTPLEYFQAYLVEKEGARTGKKHKIRWNQVTIGHGDENTIVLEDPAVSTRHARLERRGGKFYLFDLLSEHGTYLNGKKLLRPREISDFDELRMGRTSLIFRRASKPF